MTRSILAALLLFFSLGFLLGCDSSSNVLTSQTIDEIQWLPDGSGMLAIITRISSDVNTGAGAATTQLYPVSDNGAIGNAFNTADKSLPQGYPTPIGISSDKRTAVTALGTTVYRVDLSSKATKAMIKNTYLMGISQSLKYVATTQTDANMYTRFVQIYDISGSTARLAKEFTMNGVYGVNVVWMGDTAFAVWGVDSTMNSQTHIYDTTGQRTKIIQGAVPGYHKGEFASQANALILYNSATRGIVRYDVAADTQKQLIATDSLEFMDVTPSANLIAYSSGSGHAAFQLFALDPETGNTQGIGSSAYEVALSPTGNKVAYSTVEGGFKAVNIRVLPISIP